MEARLNISARLREIMSYPKFAGSTPRMLVGHGRYWIDDACIRAARRLGWEVESVPTVMEGVLPREMLSRFLEALLAFKPDFVLTANLAGMDVDGLFARLYADLEIPYATWFIDEPRSILMGSQAFASDYASAFTWERTYIPYLRACGFAEVEHLPLAADRSLFDADPLDMCSGPPAFVGSSMEDFAEREWKRLGEWPELAAALHDAFDRDVVTRERFGSGLETIIGPDLLASADVHGRRQTELVCFIEGTRRLRHALMSRLAAEGVRIYGDTGWRKAFPDSSGPVHYSDELPAFYRNCAINLNVTSIQMATAVNQRVFEAPAAGGFVLTDAQADLETLFDAPSETARYTTLEEAADLLRHFRSHDVERIAFISRARKRVLAEHTYEHRLDQIHRTLASRYSC